MDKTKYMKTEHPEYIQDLRNRAIINTNADAYKIYKQVREERLKTHRLSQEVEIMKDDISEIKQMIRSLLAK